MVNWKVVLTSQCKVWFSNLVHFAEGPIAKLSHQGPGTLRVDIEFDVIVDLFAFRVRATLTSEFTLYLVKEARHGVAGWLECVCVYKMKSQVLLPEPKSISGQAQVATKKEKWHLFSHCT